MEVSGRGVERSCLMSEPPWQHVYKRSPGSEMFISAQRQTVQPQREQFQAWLPTTSHRPHSDRSQAPQVPTRSTSLYIDPATAVYRHPFSSPLAMSARSVGCRVDLPLPHPPIYSPDYSSNESRCQNNHPLPPPPTHSPEYSSSESQSDNSDEVFNATGLESSLIQQQLLTPICETLSSNVVGSIADEQKFKNLISTFHSVAQTDDRVYWPGESVNGVNTVGSMHLSLNGSPYELTNYTWPPPTDKAGDYTWPLPTDDMSDYMTLDACQRMSLAELEQDRSWQNDIEIETAIASSSIYTTDGLSEMSLNDILHGDISEVRHEPSELISSVKSTADDSSDAELEAINVYISALEENVNQYLDSYFFPYRDQEESHHSDVNAKETYCVNISDIPDENSLNIGTKHGCESERQVSPELCDLLSVPLFDSLPLKDVLDSDAEPCTGIDSSFDRDLDTFFYTESEILFGKDISVIHTNVTAKTADEDSDDTVHLDGVQDTLNVETVCNLDHHNNICTNEVANLASSCTNHVDTVTDICINDINTDTSKVDTPADNKSASRNDSPATVNNPICAVSAYDKDFQSNLDMNNSNESNLDIDVPTDMQDTTLVMDIHANPKANIQDNLDTCNQATCGNQVTFESATYQTNWQASLEEDIQAAHQSLLHIQSIAAFKEIGSPMPDTVSFIPELRSPMPETVSFIPELRSQMPETVSVFTEPRRMMPETISFFSESISPMSETVSLISELRTPMVATVSVIPEPRTSMPEADSIVSKPGSEMMECDDSRTVAAASDISSWLRRLSASKTDLFRNKRYVECSLNVDLMKEINIAQGAQYNDDFTKSSVDNSQTVADMISEEESNQTLASSIDWSREEELTYLEAEVVLDEEICKKSSYKSDFAVSDGEMSAESYQMEPLLSRDELLSAIVDHKEKLLPYVDGYIADRSNSCSPISNELHMSALPTMAYGMVTVASISNQKAEHSAFLHDECMLSQSSNTYFQNQADPDDQMNLSDIANTVEQLLDKNSFADNSLRWNEEQRQQCDPQFSSPVRRKSVRELKSRFEATLHEDQAIRNSTVKRRPPVPKKPQTVKRSTTVTSCDNLNSIPISTFNNQHVCSQTSVSWNESYCSLPTSKHGQTLLSAFHSSSDEEDVKYDALSLPTKPADELDASVTGFSLNYLDVPESDMSSKSNTVSVNSFMFQHSYSSSSKTLSSLNDKMLEQLVVDTDSKYNERLHDCGTGSGLYSCKSSCMRTVGDKHVTDLQTVSQASKQSISDKKTCAYMNSTSEVNKTPNMLSHQKLYKDLTDSKTSSLTLPACLQRCENTEIGGIVTSMYGSYPTKSITLPTTATVITSDNSENKVCCGHVKGLSKMFEQQSMDRSASKGTWHRQRNLSNTDDLSQASDECSPRSSSDLNSRPIR